MEFCFIYGKCLIFALKLLISAVLRAFFYKNDKFAILCPGKTEVADFVSFKGSIVQLFVIIKPRGDVSTTSQVTV